MSYQPHAEYDADADAVYVCLSDADSAKTRRLDDWRMVDYAADGSVVGVEFLGVSAGVDLRDVPEYTTVENLLKDLNLRLYA